MGWQLGGRFRDTLTDTDHDLDESAAFGIIINKQADAMSQWELYLSRQSTEFDSRPDIPGINDFGLDVDYYHIGGNLAFDGPLGRPYVAATLCATRLQPDDDAFDDKTRFSFSIGGGVMMPLSDQFGARLEVRALGTVMDNDSGFLCLSDSAGSSCAVHLDGSILWQVAATAGITFRFR
jgi:hypothetical protein